MAGGGAIVGNIIPELAIAKEEFELSAEVGFVVAHGFALRALDVGAGNGGDEGNMPSLRAGRLKVVAEEGWRGG